jgi:hypothetical protein
LDKLEIRCARFLGGAEKLRHFIEIQFDHEGGPVSLHLHRFILRSSSARIFLSIIISLSFGFIPSLAQDAAQTDHGAPKYDQKTESKTKGVVDDIKVLVLGSRKDFVQLIVKSGDDKVSIYVCPKPFQDEMGITFAKGDEILVTGSKVKQEEVDVILARELVKGTDTLMFRDGKGNAVWDWKTGK